MNRSFWNKAAGVKGKTIACAVVAALSVALLFMVCSKDDDDSKKSTDCTANPNGPGCQGTTDPPSGNLQYCRWETGCYPLSNPNAPSADNPEMTELENCRAYGFVSQYSDCRDYVPPAQEYYCGWESGCYKINNPDAKDPNATGNMTYLENCQANGTLILTKAECDNYKPPVIEEYCNYGPCVGGSGYGCADGGCYPKKAGDTCSGGSIVTKCPAGTVPPSANY